eukprot:TRINITY_DN7769_c0_g1_i1.p1 TRINITY_DN7769_c0_g1~~TRINITY_DN7769_c0_g1_i1.p1  ORF type:complete len:360 (+),score=60.95 TRINITY_DN7769_c0_g1_i1:62-1081(+)
MEKYKKGEVIGQGTYGVVFLATNQQTREEVAIKKIRMGTANEGVSFVGLREIKLLQEISHPNIIKLVDVFSYNSNIYLVFDFMVTDLEQIIKDKNILLSPADIKSYMKMMLLGIEHCHKNWILHRDLKPNNLLIAKDGTLKLADFGLARLYGSPNPAFSPEAVTRWYRAPELLFASKAYSYGIDIWAVGCIFAELLLRNPFFPGASDMDQLSLIFKALGTPTEETWPNIKALPGYFEFVPSPPVPFANIFSAASDDMLSLIADMFRFSPNSRCTASAALKHKYFKNAPAPSIASKMAIPRKKIEKPETFARPVMPIKRKSSEMESSTVRRKLDLSETKA